MSSLAELDRSNVVDVDLGSAEFKANAHRLMAEWATRRPFYVLGKGPTQVVVGRYADVHKVFSDTDTFRSEMPRGPGWEQYNKIMDAQFVTQMDAEQHARVRRLLMPAFSSRRIEQFQTSITGIVDGMLDEIEKNGPEFDAMKDLGAHLVVDALLTANDRLARSFQNLVQSKHPQDVVAAELEVFSVCLEEASLHARRWSDLTLMLGEHSVALTRGSAWDFRQPAGDPDSTPGSVAPLAVRGTLAGT